MALAFFQSVAKQIGPPWLQRTYGAKLMGAMGAQLDTLVTRTAQSIHARFPGIDFTLLDDDERALSYIGNERRIRRGPTEAAETYAARLLRWLDDHATHGGAYAVLSQLFLFWGDSIGIAIDLLDYNGTVRSVDTAGNITRSSVTWGGAGDGLWAQDWVIFDFGASGEMPGYQLITEDAFLVDDAGAYLTTTFEGTLADIFEEEHTLIPREWAPAHLYRCFVVLLAGTARLWNYPQPVPIWSDWGASATWGGGDQPVIYTIEG